MNIRDFLELRVMQTPEKVFLHFNEDRRSYREFDERVNQAANAFLELGIAKGDRVCLMLPNCPEFLFTWFGLNKIGAVMVPINTAFKEEEAGFIVNHCEASGIVVSNEGRAIAEHIKNKAPHLKWVGVTGREGTYPAICMGALWDKQSTSLRKANLDEQDICTIIYTSGTTGLPKGVMHTHRSYVLCGEAMIVRAGLTPEDKLMVILPLFHANAQFYSVFGSLAAGAGLIILPRFSAERFWKQAKEYGATQFCFIGAIGRILVSRSPEEFDARHQIRVANGGHIPEDVLDGLSRRFGIPHVIDGYGLTECPCVCQNPINGIKKAGSIGLPAKHLDPKMEFTVMRVVNEYDREVPVGAIGELILKSPIMMKGYFRDEVLTEEAMRGGWFHTGDYCYQDESGYFYFVDRKKDIIRRKGENISSAEVENVLNSHPQILESAVIAVPSALSEDEVKAFVVVKGGGPVSPEEIIGWCAERLAVFKLPRFIEFREDLPKNASGRIAKFVLRDLTSQSDWDMGKYLEERFRSKTT
jgi:crotonobetaine/carnitine-CoA ligase